MKSAKRTTAARKAARKPTLKSVHEAALKLSHDDRVELIDLLSISLDQKKLDAVDAAWKKEIARRSAEIDAGTVELIPWEQVKAEVHKRWKKHGKGAVSSRGAQRLR